MRTAHKLGLLLALALAALAVTAAPASATATNTVDVTPAGSFAASSSQAEFQSNDTTVTFSCSSTLSGTIAADGSGTIDSLTFNEDCGLCTVDTAVTGLPAAFTTTTTDTVDTADNEATVTVQADTVEVVITCGAPIGDCGFSPPGDVQLNFTEGDQTITATNVRLNRTSGNIFACGTDGTWNATYTITSPVGGLTLAPI